jgi:acyl carrier protein
MSEKAEVIKILQTVKPTVDLKNVKDIMDEGYLNSIELLELITELSKRFGVEIGFELISSENFNSVESIAKMVERLKK